MKKNDRKTRLGTTSGHNHAIRSLNLLQQSADIASFLFPLSTWTSDRRINARYHGVLIPVVDDDGKSAAAEAAARACR